MTDEDIAFLRRLAEDDSLSWNQRRHLQRIADEGKVMTKPGQAVYEAMKQESELRDGFAGQAMAALLKRATLHNEPSMELFIPVARHAYCMADAMLQARREDLSRD
jgi:hypothetical protein